MLPPSPPPHSLSQDWVIHRLFPNRDTGLFSWPFWALHAPSATFGPFVLRAGLLAGVAIAHLGRGAIQTRDPLDDVLRMIGYVYAATQTHSELAAVWEDFGRTGRATALLISSLLQSSSRATRALRRPSLTS